MSEVQGDWANAVKHYDEEQKALIAPTAAINAFNRVNVIVHQPAGDDRPGQFG